MKIYLILSCISVILCVNVKTDDQNAIQEGYNTDYSNCKVVEECHPCTFEELKIETECYNTGYKLRRKCESNSNEELYVVESCNENMKTNPVYIMLIICILLCFFAWRLQKNLKDSFMKNIFQKITIFKEG